MLFEIQTLALIQCLIFVTQAIVLFVQYRVNRTYRGIRWWVLGSAFMAIGVIFMPMLTIKSLEMLARIANPLVVLGQIFLYIGILQFLDKKVNRWILATIYVVFVLTYFAFMYIINDISARTIVINATLATISILSAYKLVSRKDKHIFGSANFTAIVFFIYGCFLIVRFLFALLLPPMRDYSDQATILIIGFIVPTITSTLWTYGFIIMLNQRLNIENFVEKEKMQLVFNTSPDAAMITRKNDGLFIDVNNGFSVMTGYARDEVIGDFTLKTNLWHDLADRNKFLAVMDEKEICENMEFVFGRKDGRQFAGMISARIITINNVPHIVSTIRDITERKQAEEERKLAEQKIQQLVQQLEIEKNIAQLNSITDSLTGLANRRYFDDALKTEFYRLKRTRSKLSLLMLDIDYFKNYNDSYGHLAGDDCLIQIGNMFKTIIRQLPDIAVRYGGEEFIVILPETNEYGAKALAERIRKSVENLAIPHSASDISEYITASIGVVTVDTTDFATPEQVVTLADEALYRAKKGGRNRIEVATDNTMSGNNHEV